MPRGAAPPWRQRKEPILDSHLQASVTQANGVHDELGHYAELVYAGCATRDRAKEIQQALHRAGNHLGFSVSARIEKNGDEWQVRYKAIDKAHAKKYILEKYGNDRSKWPYDPRRKGR
jgi:hypothetical protein